MKQTKPGDIIIPVRLADPQRDGNANFSNQLQDNADIRKFTTRFDLQRKLNAILKLILFLKELQIILLPYIEYFFY